MYKILLLMVVTLSGCSNFKITASMCDNLQREPGNTEIPKECRDYDEDEATKAFEKVVDKKKVSDKDIEFDLEREE